MDREAWSAVIHGVTKCWTLLSDWTDLNWTEWSSVFPHFLQFKSEFGNKEFLIWVTDSSCSCLCWLYRASPSSAAKNIINLISVLTMSWFPCVEFSLVLLGQGVCNHQCVLSKTLLVFSQLHFVLEGQICLFLHVSLDFLLLHSGHLWWKGHLFCVLVLENLVGPLRTFQLHFLLHYLLEYRLRSLWY